MDFETIARHWYAHWYEHNETQTHDVQFLLDVLREQGVKAQSRILEIACGGGRIAIPLARAGFDVTGFADWARIIVDDDGRTLVHATVENDDAHHFREQYWVLLQEEPGEVKAEGFESDGRLAVIPIDRDGNARPGVMVDGTKLWLNEADLSGDARRAQMRSVFEVSR